MPETPNKSPLSIFSDLRGAVADRLRSSVDIAGPPKVEVLSFDASDLDDRINRTLTQSIGGESAAGIAIIVGTVGMDIGDQRHELRGILGITIVENVAINSGVHGSGLKAEDLQSLVYAMLMFDDDGESNWYPSEVWSELTMRESAVQEVGQRIIYTMTFESNIRVLAQSVPVAQPSL